MKDYTLMKLIMTRLRMFRRNPPGGWDTNVRMHRWGTDATFTLRGHAKKIMEKETNPFKILITL